MSELFDRLPHHHDGPKLAELIRVPVFEHVPRRQLAVIAANLDEVSVVHVNDGPVTLPSPTGRAWPSRRAPSTSALNAPPPQP